MQMGSLGKRGQRGKTEGIVFGNISPSAGKTFSDA